MKRLADDLEIGPKLVAPARILSVENIVQFFGKIRRFLRFFTNPDMIPQVISIGENSEAAGTIHKLRFGMLKDHMTSHVARIRRHFQAQFTSEMSLLTRDVHRCEKILNFFGS